MLLVRHATEALAGLVVAFVVAGCSSSHPSSDTAHNDISELIAAGVARVSWSNATQQADLNLREMTALDAVSPSETTCPQRVGSRHPLFFDFNWRGVRDKVPVPATTVSIATLSGRYLMVAEPDGRCVPMHDYPIAKLPPLPGEQFVLQLLAPSDAAAAHSLRQLVVTLDGSRHILRLVRACRANEAQPPSRTCVIDPVGFDDGSAYSVRWLH